MFATNVLLEGGSEVVLHLEREPTSRATRAMNCYDQSSVLMGCLVTPPWRKWVSRPGKVTENKTLIESESSCLNKLASA